MPEPVTQNNTVSSPQHQQQFVGPQQFNAKNYTSKKFGVGIASGTIAGGSAGGWIGAGIGAAAGLASDLLGLHANKKRQKEMQDFNRQEAAAAYNRQNALAARQEQYNSVQNQVRQLREAGLNPALAYGSLGTAQAAQGAAPQASANAANSYDYAGLRSIGTYGTDAALAAAQIGNLNQNTASQFEDTFAKQASNTVAYSRAQLDILKQLQEIEKLKASTNLDDAQRQNLDNTYNMMLNYYKKLGEKLDSDISSSNIQNKLVEAQTVTEQQKPANVRADTRLKGEQAKTEQTQQNLNGSAARLNDARSDTEVTQQGLNRELASSEQVKRELMTSEKELNGIKTSDLRLKYKIDKEQYDVISNWCKEHGLSGYEKTILCCVGEFAASAGSQTPKTILSWLDAGNWLQYLSTKNWLESIHRSNEQGGVTINNNTVNNTNTNSDNNQRPDAVRPHPNQSSYEKHINQIYQKMNDSQAQLYKYFMNSTYPKLNDKQKYDFRSDVYQVNSPDDVIRICQKYSQLIDN